MTSLGKEYKEDEVIVRQGETGNCMFVIQEGEVEAVAEPEGKEFRLRTMGPNEFFGETALFERKTRTETIRAMHLLLQLTRHWRDQGSTSRFRRCEKAPVQLPRS